MTINATAMWLVGMYLALADEQGVDYASLQGTTQNDILKEYLSRGTYIFPPEASKRLTVDLIVFMVQSLANAIGVLDAVRESGQIPADEFPQVVGRISFFIDAGVRFVEEMCKMRAFTQMWDHICATRYGVTDEKLRRFRYGMQVNSLGLTEEQPENNIQRIVLEMLGVTLSKDARARAIQLPCWNEALGLPTPWDQQWSLRIQQVLAYESDLLEYGDLFEGSKVVEAKVAELREEAETELQWVLDGGGSFEMIDAMKGRLVQSHAERVRRIESGDLKVVGVNAFTETAPSPLADIAQRGGIVTIDPAVERAQVEALEAWKRERDGDAVDLALERLRKAAATDENLVPATIELARVGGTVGEWSGALRDVFGEYRAPTGVGAVSVRPGAELEGVRARVQAAADGHPIRILVGKPGLDGHSNGAEQIAVAARDAGMEVVYQGIRLTPAQIAAAARDEDVDIVGLSILSGSHLALVPETLRLLREVGVTAPVVVGGIIPDSDRGQLERAGIARVFTPKDYRLGGIMSEVADLALAHRSAQARAATRR
jgi:(2R)-ethylmalonyl-CoA mutase